MTEPTFGVTFQWRNDEVRSVAGGDFSGVALVGPAPAADSAAFPLNEPVAFYSNDTATLGRLGAEGWLKDAVDGINDQLAELQRAAKICIVRTPHSTTPDAPDRLEEEITGIVGSSAAKTGLHALKWAASEIGWTPRLVGVPGYTHQSLGAGEANPVCAELPAVLNHLLAVAVVEGPAGSVEGAIAWREALASKRLIEWRQMILQGRDMMGPAGI